MTAGRNSFTQRDAHYLAQYIAKYNPVSSGRLGNKLYETLTENAQNKWSWSQRHPWQSWRNYYKNNQTIIDRKVNELLREQAQIAENEAKKIQNKGIQKVQAKAGTSFKRKPAQIKQEPVPIPAQPVASATVDAKRKEEEEEEEVSDSQADEEESRPAGPVGDDDYMHELFGSYVEEDDEEEQPKESQSSLPSSPRYDKIYPNIRDAPNPAVPEKELHVPGAFDTRLPAPTLHSKSMQSSPIIPSSEPRRVLRRKVLQDKDDIFATPPPSSPPQQRVVQTKGKPPVLREGVFRNTFKVTKHDLSDEEEEEEEAKPWFSQIRGKKRSRQEQEPEVEADAEATAAPPPKATEPPPTPRPVAPKPKGKGLPPPPRTRPPLQVKQVNAVASSSKVQLPAPADGDHQVQKRQKVEHSPTAKAVVAPVLSKDSFTVVGRSSAHSPPANPSDSDIFNSKGKAPEAIPKIDLRTGLRQRLSRRNHGSTSSRTSTASRSHTRQLSPQNLRRRSSNMSSHSTLSDKDAKILSIIRQDLRNLGSRYGFSLEFVEKKLEETGSIEKTKDLLEALHSAVGAMEKALHDTKPHLFVAPLSGKRRGLGRDTAASSDSEVPEGIIPRHHEATALAAKVKAKPRQSGLSAKRARPSLNYKPLPPDDTEPLSDYSPPNKTRAGQYARLVKEGREDEALKRETRYTQELSRRSKGLLGSSPMAQQSPTPQRREVSMDVDRMNPPKDEDELEDKDDDMYVDKEDVHQADDESEDDLEHQQEAQLPEFEMDDHTSLGHDTSVNKHISAGQTTLDEDEHPNIQALSKEFRTLVTAANLDKLMQFEQSNSSHLMRRWTASLVEERLEVARQALERRRAKEKAAAEQEVESHMEEY